MRVYEETWGLDAYSGSMKRAVYRSDGDGVADVYSPPSDGGSHAALIAQAPAMARLLLKIACDRCLIGKPPLVADGEIDDVLRAAGVIT